MIAFLDLFLYDFELSLEAIYLVSKYLAATNGRSCNFDERILHVLLVLVQHLVSIEADHAVPSLLESVVLPRELFLICFLHGILRQRPVLMVAYLVAIVSVIHLSFLLN